MRGTYTATYLAKVSETYAKRRGATALDLGVAFNLIVGTSTGAIIACALAAGVPLGEVVSLYRQHGAAIFPRPVPESLPAAVLDHVARAKAIAAGADALRAALTDKLGSATLADIYARRGIALAIPAVEMGQHRAWVFKTPHFGTTNNRDDNYTLVDVCMASTAAPVFRSLAAIDHSDEAGTGFRVFVDGGLWANNPVLVGLIEALDVTQPGQHIQIFCMGSCPMPAGEQIARSAVHRGLSEWKFGSKAAELSIDAQQFAYDHMAKKLARHVDRHCTVIRFPADKVPATVLPYLGLDDTRPEAIEALVNQARTDADMTNSKCAYRDSDPEAELICSLFETAPERRNPLVSRQERRVTAAPAR
jgi:hypothetical protein